MRIPAGPFYFIWMLLQFIFFNFGLFFSTGNTPNFFGTLFIILFFHIAVTLPVMSLIGQSKNENS